MTSAGTERGEQGSLGKVIVVSALIGVVASLVSFGILHLIDVEMSAAVIAGVVGAVAGATSGSVAASGARRR